MIDQLSDLPHTTPAAPSADRVRRRCHAALAHKHAAKASPFDGLLFTVCAAYLVTAAVQLLVFF